MALQNQVNATLSIGVPGSRADMNTFDYYPQTLIAENPISVGSFVWLGSDKEVFASYAKEDETSSPIGFVERVTVYPAYNMLDEGSLVIASNEGVSIATKGTFYAIATTSAVAGQAVFARLADGSIVTGEKGSQVENAIETEWVVITGGQAGETIIIKRS